MDVKYFECYPLYQIIVFDVGEEGEGSDFVETSTSNRMARNLTSAIAEEEEMKYMTLRSRTLMSKRPRSTGWQSNNTFEMLSMHGAV